MRVIAGSRRSLPLKSPQGMNTRPTADRIKETLFNMLQPYLAGGVFIDLFAGSGGIGIEALSRGARKCYFVENDRKAAACIKENLKFTKFEEESVLLQTDVLSSLHQISESAADVIFMDPPYHEDYEKKVLAVLAQKSYVTEETLIVTEAALDTEFGYLEELGFVIVKQKKYKTNQHVFLKKCFYENGMEI